MSRAALAAALAVLSAVATLPAAPVGQGGSAVAEAVSLGLSGDEARLARFHERYVERLGGPLVRSLEVVTDFRRAVLMAEERFRMGESAWPTERAAARLAPHRGRLALVLHLRFDPMNTYRTAPQAAVVIYRRGRQPDLLPLDLEVTAENFTGRPVLPGEPILGATVRASYLRSAIDDRRPFLVGLFLGGRELQRIPLDISGLR